MASSISPNWATSAIVRDQEQGQPPVTTTTQQHALPDELRSAAQSLYAAVEARGVIVLGSMPTLETVSSMIFQRNANDKTHATIDFQDPNTGKSIGSCELKTRHPGQMDHIAQQVERYQSLAQTTSPSPIPQEAHPSLYASSRGNHPTHPSLRDFRGTPPLNSGGESSSWHEQYPKGLYINQRDYTSYRLSSVRELAATAKRHETELASIYIFAHQTDGMAHFMYQKRPKPAFFIWGEHAKLLHEYFSSQREQRTLKAHVGYGYTVIHDSEKDWPFLCLLDRRLVPAMIASERHLYESNGLPKEASEEQINAYMESLLTSNIAMMENNTIMHGHLAGYGLENAEKNEEWGKSDDPDKRVVDSPPSLHHLGTVNTALAARQIEMAMPPEAVKPFWFRAWDSDETTRIVRDSVEAAFAINEELAEAYNKKRETDPDETFADFLMDYGLTKLFDEP